MSQKTNPISLRLQNSNKHFESCWYSDFFYEQMLGDQIQLGFYLEGLLNQAGRSKTLPSMQSQYKRFCTLLFFLDQRAERHKREFSLKLSRESVEQVLLPKTKFLQRKNKVCISVWDGLLFIKVQDILHQENLSQKERYKTLIEEGTKRKRSGLSHNCLKEYVYNYAIKSSSLEVPLLSGLSCTKVINKGRAYLSNTIINPGLKYKSFTNSASNSATRTKQSFVTATNSATLSSSSSSSWPFRVANSNKKSNNFFINSKSFLSFSIISFALAKAVPCIQEPPLKAKALVWFAEQSFIEIEKQVDLFLHNANSSMLSYKAKNAVSFNDRAIKKSTKNIFSVQEGERVNLFRRLIIDQYSQSNQNRLSYCFVKSLKKQFRCTNTLFLLDHKYCKRLSTFTPVNLAEKIKLKKNISNVIQQEWRSKSLGLARYTELFLNNYSGIFGYHTVSPIRAISPFQSAAFLVESVAYLLQRKSSFRQIKDDFFRELDQYQALKGARLSCAGRLGGRSKKAQKAKTQSAQWGETSLTIFSSRLDFASKGVNTPYGKVGVKLWLCYKS